METIDYNHQKLPEPCPPFEMPHPQDDSYGEDSRLRESKFTPLDPNFQAPNMPHPPNFPHPPDMPHPLDMPRPPDMPRPSFQGPMQVFDYNHRPPPVNWDVSLPPRPPFPPVPPPPPHMQGGPHPFNYDPNMGPPPQHFPPPLPSGGHPFPPPTAGPRPPLPPPRPSLPYFELPAGVMIPLIPVSVLIIRIMLHVCNIVIFYVHHVSKNR